MVLKEKVITSLEREQNICEVAVKHLREECLVFEEKYKMSTQEFLTKFNKGVLGDEEDFFRWYSLAEAIEDWLNTRRALEEILR